MDIFSFHIGFINSGWSLYNISLALIPVIFGILTYKTKSRFLKIIFGVIWILFLPNTIYLLTDIEHLPEDVSEVTGIFKILLYVEYGMLMIVGVVTFLFGLYPFEKMLKLSKKTRHQRTLFIVLMNFLIAFGMVLGRVQRLNSWDVFFNIPKVISDSLNIISSRRLTLLFLVFAAMCNILYFYCRGFVVKTWKILK